MTQEAGQDSVLAGCRVLDFADEKGVLCAKLLGDMGADVIKVEPPGGDHTRGFGPFVDNVPHPERSLYFWHYNTSKRGVTLSIESTAGGDLLRKLVATADVLVESYPPGYLDSLGLGYQALHRLNPALIMTSITGFGQTGPRRDYKLSDIVGQALGGMMYVNGDPDSPPVCWAGLQAYHSASYYAAIGTMCALMARDLSGSGQHVDVSIEESVCSAVEHVNSAYLYPGRMPGPRDAGRIARRQGTLHWSAGFHNARAKDGYVLMSWFGDWDTLVAWLESEGMAADLTDPKYNTDPRLRADEAPHIFEVMAEWAATHTSQELVDGAQLRRIPFAYIRAPSELLAEHHLQERGFFHQVEHPELGRSVVYPGAPYKFNGTPWRISRRAPLIGEHNSEVYGKELGLSQDNLASLAEAGVI